MASKEEAEKLAAACHLSTATVKSIDRKHRTEKPPKLYDLTTLQREANRYSDIPPSKRLTTPKASMKSS